MGLLWRSDVWLSLLATFPSLPTVSSGGAVLTGCREALQLAARLFGFALGLLEGELPRGRGRGGTGKGSVEAGRERRREEEARVGRRE